ncbi:RNA polymerase sigma factor [Solibacillus isronensis]|uniref:RNA polymerase sigma factor n=1 Tax=Solibacillus isronensis TaxID=412383 RepID=UPI00399FC402
MVNKEVYPINSNSYLLSNIKSNPTEAIEDIMDTYGNDVKKFIYTYLKNEADTDDVTQDVFVTVYLKIGTFKGDSSLKTWIYSIAANMCKDYIRRHRLRPQNLFQRLTQQEFKKNQTSDIAEDYIRSTVKEGLFEKIMELPVKYREVIILYYYKDLSIKEISYVLKEKESTLQSRLLRARKKLRELINKGGIVLG